jgi:hypothetical protein
VSKKEIVFCIFAAVLGLILAGTAGYFIGDDSGELAGARQLSLEYRSELDRAAERIASLEASRNRLNGYLRSASGNVDRLESLTGQTIGDTRAAIGLVKEITIQVQSLIGELDRWRSDSGGGGGMDNVEPM